MLESFTLFDSAVWLMDEKYAPSSQTSKLLADSALGFGPYYRPTKTLDISDARKRRSRRCYGERQIELIQLVQLLQLALFDPDEPERRPYPAAGAIYSNQVYLVVRGVRNLASGVYFVRWIDRAVEKIGDIDGDFMRDAVFQENKANIDCIVLLVADVNLAKAKYHDRAVRFALLEAGALMQTVYLAAERLELAVCALGAVGDRAAVRLCQREHSRDVFLSSALSICAKS